MNDLHTTHVQLAANLTATSKCQKAPERNTVVVSSYQVVNINFSSLVEFKLKFKRVSLLMSFIDVFIEIARSVLALH